uniref:Integrase catalytic domain-containing protein n=1 Tax=Trichuris muris TaxID=70415 RepID=A0A5S6Q433_TRIMR
MKGFGGAMYTLTITDDATRYVSVRFLRNKESVLGKFERWLSEAEGQSGRRLKRIRTDNGLEFCSKAWENFCSLRGIIDERTMVYTPQLNGVAERLNRTLLDLVRSTMSGSSLPRASWAELTSTAAYICNRVMNKHNQRKTPCELWFNRRPSARQIRACGCAVYVHVPSQKRKSKLEPRARKGLLVGYVSNGKGWQQPPKGNRTRCKMNTPTYSSQERNVV